MVTRVNQKIHETLVTGLAALLGDPATTGDDPAWHFQAGLIKVNLRLEHPHNGHLRLWKFDPRRTSSGSAAEQFHITNAVDVQNTLCEIERSVLVPPAGEDLLATLMDELLEVHQTSMGDLQLFNPRTSKLRLIECRGFPADFSEQFRWLSPSEASTVCAKAFRDQARTFITDLALDAEFTEILAAGELHGFRAVHSIPLLLNGKLMGIVSCHLPQPGPLSEAQEREVQRIMHARQSDLSALMT